MRASRWETLGAWLRVWTPPREVEVPPPPSVRSLALGILLIVVLVGGLVAGVAPRIDAGKDERAAREERALDARRAARAAATRAEQRPRFGRAPAGSSRAEIIDRLEAAISRDAVARFERGELPARAGATRCEQAPRGDGRLLECLAAVREIVRGGEQGDAAAGRLGYPFRAVIDVDRASWAFCKVNPPPGERVPPDPRYVVQLPPQCRAPGG